LQGPEEGKISVNVRRQRARSRILAEQGQPKWEEEKYLRGKSKENGLERGGEEKYIHITPDTKTN